MTDELIKLEERDGIQTVSARDLHEKLEITERFSSWFKRMLKYGFEENVDFTGCKVFNTLAKQELDEYYISLDMAKEICMIQRSEIGRKIGQYLEEIYWKNKLLPQINSSNSNIYIDTSVSSGKVTGVNARDLWKKLGIGRDFSNWFKQMVSYGFEEGSDFSPFLAKTIETGRPSKEYVISLDMAKEICMIQRSEIGRKFRQYFIDCEKQLFENKKNIPTNTEIMASIAQTMQILATGMNQNTNDIKLLKSEVEDLKKVNAVNPIHQDYYSIIAFCRLNNIEITTSEAKNYGKRCVALSIKLGFAIYTVPDERWGRINSYHVNVLNKVILGIEKGGKL